VLAVVASDQIESEEKCVFDTKWLCSCVLILTSASGCAKSDENGIEEAEGADWLAGYWLACSKGTQTAEAWIGARSGLLVGANHGLGSDGPSFEHMRIGPDERGQLAYFASPAGAPTVIFALKSLGNQTATFENLKHDFPHRVIYMRRRDELVGRIEGVIDGKPQSMEWHYRLAPLGENCAP